MKKGLLAFILLTATLFSSAQIAEMRQIQLLYSSADSVAALHRHFQPDKTFTHELDSLNQLHPSQYFTAVNGYVTHHEWDKASFVYLLGVLRYRFYNQTYKKYSASADGALFSSLSYATGEMVSIYLKSDIEKYISLLKAVDHYVSTIEYAYHPTRKNKKEYNEVRYTKLIEDLKANWQQYEAEWIAERAQIQEGIRLMMEEYNKLTEEEKEQLKH